MNILPYAALSLGVDNEAIVSIPASVVTLSNLPPGAPMGGRGSSDFPPLAPCH